MNKASTGLVVNPVLMLALLYFLANLASFFILISGGDIFVDALLMAFDGSVVYLTGAVLLVSFLSLLLLYKFCLMSFSCKKELLLSDNWGWFLLVLQCVFWASNSYYGVNLAGVEDLDKGNPFKIFFNFFQPDLIYLIVAVGLVSVRLFWANSIIFACSMVARGWMGGVSVVFIIYFCRNYPVKLGPKLFFKLFLLFFIGVMVFPFWVELKWALRAGTSLGDVWSEVFDRGYWKSLGESLAYVLNRFQMFGHVALIAENSSVITRAYDNNEFIPYWADGLPQWFILKMNDIEVFQLNRYMVRYFFESDNLAYSTNPGVAGWLLILQEKIIFFAIFILAVIILPAFIIFKYAGRKYLLILFSLVFVYLFHGWIGAYFNFLIYMIVILFLGRISSRNIL